MNNLPITLNDIIDPEYKNKYGGITTSSTAFFSLQFALNSKNKWSVYSKYSPAIIGEIRPNKQKKPSTSKIQFRPDLPDGYYIYIHYIVPNHNLSWPELTDLATFLQILNNEQPKLNHYD